MSGAVLDAAGVARWILTVRDALRAHQEELNRLNVYPVPDGDTGTNMALTVESVVSELPDPPSMPAVCHAIAQGSLLGARGNSGVILSQVLRGFADTFATAETVDAMAWTTALRRATDAAYDAVMRPVEGTILTVVRRAAEAAERAVTEDADLVALLETVTDAASAAVAETPELLPVLKEAGVVDAGGRGFVLLLDSALHVLTGRPIPEPTHVSTPARVEAHLHGDDVSSLRYEVMYLLQADDGTIPGFRDAWSAIGDSIVVVGGEGLWNCHVHTNDIGAAIEAGIDAGRPQRIRVTDLFEQVEEEEAWVREHEGAVIQLERERCTTAVVAVGVGAGVHRLLASLGVQAIVAGGQSMNPSTAQILEAVEQCRADSVIVLPNNKNIIAVAQQVNALCDRDIAVVPTTAVVEALAALVEYDPQADVARNVEAMTEAFERVRHGEVTQAVRRSNVEIGEIEVGDWIAVVRSGISAIGKNASEVAIALADQLITEQSELLTMLVGADARPADTAHIEEHLALAHPHIEVELHVGGQPLYPYLIGVE